jgi:hypothetical protein
MGLGEKKHGRRAEKLRDINEEMLIPWMKTMLGQIGRRYVIQQVVERSDNRTPYQISPGDRMGCVKRSVKGDCHPGREKPGYNQYGKRQGPRAN